MNTVANGEETRTKEAPRAAQPVVAPPVNIIETKDGYTLEAEIPGVSNDGVEITVEENQLTILGRRNRTDSKAQVLYRESADTDYRRVFELDPAVDATKITANVEQGVLTIQLPFSERVKPRKISIAE
ncbi:MAG TPA: Hsp20/alpha crystallin family protein [Verrucomicrobiae bacterium]|jgi:HSP20 family protein|nr:Hsp20/alpha crystallin family protein [Verrucomicrobiae bacterium]